MRPVIPTYGGRDRRPAGEVAERAPGATSLAAWMAMYDSLTTRSSEFADSLRETRLSLAEIEEMIPADPRERDQAQALLGMAVVMLQTQIDAAVILWEISETVMELLLGRAALSEIEPLELPAPQRLQGTSRVEITAKVLSGVEPALGIDRNEGPVNWSEELNPLSGSRFRPRRRRAVVAGILGPGEA